MPSGAWHGFVTVIQGRACVGSQTWVGILPWSLVLCDLGQVISFLCVLDFPHVKKEQIVPTSFNFYGNEMRLSTLSGQHIRGAKWVSSK